MLALKPVVPEGSVLWHDNDIHPGAKWQVEIDNALAQAGVALLLFTQDFLASDYIKANELPYLLAASEEKGLLKILWVAVKSSTFDTTPIAQYQALNNLQTPPSQDDA